MQIKFRLDHFESILSELSFKKFILERSIFLNKTAFKPDGVNLQNHKIIVSAKPLSFSIKRKNERKINGPITSQITMSWCF